MKYYLLFFLFLLYLFPSCRNKKSDLITYKLKSSDFVEKIVAGGTVQAVNNLTITSPTASTSFLTVDHLVPEGSYVKKGDTICVLGSPELLNMVESFTTELVKMEADMKKLEADNALEMSLLKAQIETNKAQVAISSLDSIQMKFATPVKKQLLGLEQQKVDIEKKKLAKKLAAQVKINNSEVSQLKSRIMIQKNRIQVYQNQVNSLYIIAPLDGIVMHVESPVLMFMSSQGIGTLGGRIEEKSTVYTSMALLQIPDMRQMQVLVEVPEADFKRIEERQKVNIRIDAVKNLYTTGLVKRKNAAAKRTSNESAVKTFEVIISVDSCHLQLKPGLSAHCEILVKEVKDTLVVPIAAIFGKDSSKIVYVNDGDKFRAVPVRTGISNSTDCIISSGLKGNETLSLVEPPYNLIIKENSK
jgi:HlyD family secretion protein